MMGLWQGKLTPALRLYASVQWSGWRAVVINFLPDRREDKLLGTKTVLATISCSGHDMRLDFTLN